MRFVRLLTGLAQLPAAWGCGQTEPSTICYCYDALDLNHGTFINLKFDLTVFNLFFSSPGVCVISIFVEVFKNP